MDWRDDRTSASGPRSAGHHHSPVSAAEPAAIGEAFLTAARART